MKNHRKLGKKHTGIREKCRKLIKNHEKMVKNTWKLNTNTTKIVEFIGIWVKKYREKKIENWPKSKIGGKTDQNIAKNSDHWSKIMK